MVSSAYLRLLMFLPAILIPACASSSPAFLMMYSACSCYCLVTSVVSDSVHPHRLQPTRLPRPGDSPGKNTGVGCHFLLQCTKVKSESEVAQSCPTLSDPMDCNLPGSSVHGVFQARVLEWGAIALLAYVKQMTSGKLKRWAGRSTSWNQNCWEKHQ